jgi:hypothetical protein
MNFYPYTMLLRAGAANQSIRYLQLGDRFVVGKYAKIESERLLFVRLNRKKFRLYDYIRLQYQVGRNSSRADGGANS